MRQVALCAFSAFSLAACSGGSTSSAGVDPGGVYVGTVSIAGNSYSVLGIIDESGLASLVEETGTTPTSIVAPYSPIATAPDGSFSASGAVYGINGALFEDGSSMESTTVAGVVVPRSSIKGTTTDAAGNVGSFTLDYQASAYQSPSSLSMIEGDYTSSYSSGGTTVNMTLSISSSGSISGSDTAGCTYSGYVSVPNPSYNAYNTFLINSCLSNGPEIGLATYSSSEGENPATLVSLGHDASDGYYTSFTKSD